MVTTRIILLFALVAGVSAARFDVTEHTSRLLLATEDDVLDEGDTSEEPSVYQVASSTFGGLFTLGTPTGWTVNNLTVTLELDTEATYANNFNINNAGTWAPGTTRVNVTVNLTQSGGTTSSNYQPPAIQVTLHTATCEQGVNSGNIFEQSNKGTTNSVPALAISENLTASSTGNAFNSTIVPFLVDYDLAKSVAVLTNGVYMSCRDLIPPFPDFPNDWSATIENNDVTNAYTYVFQETYSQSLNMIRLDLHSFATDRIIVSNASSSAVTIINPNNGSCQARGFGRGFNYIFDNETDTLIDTAELLHFTSDNDITYTPGFVNVRGIPCEVWTTYVDVTTSRWNASFDVQYYFPVNEWLVAREDYHRLLKRVYMNGTRNGEPFETYHEYVNFRPRTMYPSLFETCAISPYGSNCNCTDALRKAAFINGTQTFSEDSGDGLSVEGSTTLGCPSMPHGFVSAQSGPYVGLTIIGMVAGSLITGLAMYLFYRKRVGVRITDNLGHQKFQDGTT